MSNSNMMKQVQIEKINSSIDKILYLFKTQEELFKKYVPINETLILNLQKKANVTINQIMFLIEVVKSEKEELTTLYQISEKNALTKLTKPKDPKDQSPSAGWAKTITRFEQSLAENHEQRMAKFKNMNKSTENIQNELTKQSTRYKADISKQIKELKSHFQKIDQISKQQSKSLNKMIKQSKNVDKNESVLFLSETKKIYLNYVLQIKTMIERNKMILQLIKTIVSNEKAVCKKINEQFKIFLNNRKQVFQKLQSDEKLWGSLTVIEDGVNENCEKHLQTILIQDHLVLLRKLAPQQKNNISTILIYLNSDFDTYQTILEGKSTLKAVCNSMAFKCWGEISLAGGWLLTSFTPAEMYLTFDHLIVIYDLQGNLLKKIQASFTKISKVEEDNIFLSEVIKGFFTDSVSEYQIKFSDYDRMEQFQLFIENQIK